MTETIKPPVPRRMMATRTAVVAGLLLAGAVAGAAVVAVTRPAVETAPLTPVPIARLPDSNGPITIHARVAEVFGHDVIVADGTGRALVDFGPEGDGRSLVTVGTTPLIQGQFDRGILHATFVQDEAGHLTALAPPPPAPPRHAPPGGPMPEGVPPPPPPAGIAPSPPPAP